MNVRSACPFFLLLIFFCTYPMDESSDEWLRSNMNIGESRISLTMFYEEPGLRLKYQLKSNGRESWEQQSNQVKKIRKIKTAMIQELVRYVEKQQFDRLLSFDNRRGALHGLLRTRERLLYPEEDL
ncbi:hypothetical protein ACFLX2_00305 [Candidatus Dependentiae bacterium]